MNKSNLVVTGFVVIAVLFAFYQVYLMNAKATSTQIAVQTTVYDSIKTKGVFIRHETTIDGAKGVVVQSVADGGKVQKDGEVAKVFADKTTAQNYSKLAQLQEELDYYKNLQSQTLGEATDIESMDKEIWSHIGTLVQQDNNNPLEQRTEKELELVDALIRRQLLTGQSIDLASVIAGIQGQIDVLNKSGVTPDSILTTAISGNFALGTDGYEDYFNDVKLEECTPEQITTFLKDTKKKKQTDFMGKIVTDFNWYIACIVKSEAVAGIQEGAKVAVNLQSNASVVLNAVLYAKNLPSPQSEECALVLQCSNMGEAVPMLRNEEIEIRLQSYSGLRVDSRGIRTQDGEKGVYVLISNKIVFRKIDEIYSGDGFAIVKLDNSDSKNIQLYDSVIVEGKDLYDGKYIN